MSAITQEARKGMALIRLSLFLLLAACAVPTGDTASSQLDPVDPPAWLPTLTGRVLSPDGTPMADALVCLTGRATGPRLAYMSGPRRRYVVRTDASGRYEIADVVPFENQWIQVLGSRGAYFASGLTELGWIGARRRAAEIELDPIQLHPGRELVLQFVGTFDDQPVVGLELAPRLLDGRVNGPVVRPNVPPTKTDAQGLARLWVADPSVLPGEPIDYAFAIRYQQDGIDRWWGLDEPMAEGGSIEEPSRWDLPDLADLPPDPQASVRLSFVDTEGEPFAAQRVFLAPSEWALEGVSRGPGVFVTDPRGMVDVPASLFQPDLVIRACAGPDVLTVWSGVSVR